MTSTGEPYPQLTLFAADTHANHSATPAQETAQTTPDTSGHVSPTAFAYFDQDSRCWKTCQGTLLSDSEMSKPIWPRSGMTLNGIAYQRQPSAHRTSATEYSLSQHVHTWATPTTQEIEHLNMKVNEKGRRATKSGHGRGWAIGLADQVRLWPTPQAGDAKRPKVRHYESSEMPMLGGTVASRHPEEIGGSLNPAWVEWLMGFPIGWTDLEDLETP